MIWPGPLAAFRAACLLSGSPRPSLALDPSLWSFCLISRGLLRPTPSVSQGHQPLGWVWMTSAQDLGASSWSCIGWDERAGPRSQATFRICYGCLGPGGWAAEVPRVGPASGRAARWTCGRDCPSMAGWHGLAGMDIVSLSCRGASCPARRPYHSGLSHLG